jgi:U-box domain
MRPSLLRCALQEVMMRPALCVGDGHSYEEAAIAQWLQAHGTSPVTGQPLATTELLPNHALRQMIQAAAGGHH